MCAILQDLRVRTVFLRFNPDTPPPMAQNTIVAHRNKRSGSSTLRPNMAVGGAHHRAAGARRTGGKHTQQGAGKGVAVH
jgi:hypothetical protein